RALSGEYRPGTACGSGWPAPCPDGTRAVWPWLEMRKRPCRSRSPPRPRGQRFLMNAYNLQLKPSEVHLWVNSLTFIIASLVLRPVNAAQQSRGERADVGRAELPQILDREDIVEDVGLHADILDQVGGRKTGRHHGLGAHRQGDRYYGAILAVGSGVVGIADR